MTGTIKLIAIDLDGTLLNSQHQLSRHVEETVKQAVAMGIQVVLATGKSRASAIGIIERLGLKTPGVFVQGLVIHNADGTIRHQEFLDNEVARRVIDFSENTADLPNRSDLTMVAYGGGRILTPVHNPHIDRLADYGEPTPEFVGPLSKLVGTLSFNKIHFTYLPNYMDELRRQLSATLAGTGTLVRPNPDILEVLPLGASKGAGVKWLLNDLNINPQNVMAIGDGENDIEMLQLAGIGVAMGNAMPRAKEAADQIVASNDEDGVAEAIERFAFTS